MADKNMRKPEEPPGRGLAPAEGAGAGDGECGSSAFDGEYFSEIVKETTAWDIYNNEARKIDRELVKDWTTSLNFLLVFAAIFSAVLAAFTIESKKLLEQDYTQLMLDVMIFHTNNLANGTHLPYKPAEYTPSNSAISINCLLFGSLSISLVAALASVIALQWVAEFDASITRGGSSPQDRAKRRQFRFSGLKSWRMGELIASLPLLLYVSVVLFFAGLIQWTLILNSTVGSIVIGGAATALLFYFVSTFLAVVLDSAPFITPLSRWIHSGSHRLLIYIHRIIHSSRTKKPPEWLIRYHKGYHTSYKREDRAIEARIDLSYQAMNWVARQISISEDSRRRLVLLAGELLEWPREQFESQDFRQAPWIPILNLLAQKHIAALQVPTQTREEEKEFALLVNCSALPTIKALISPEEGQYWDNPDEARYWTQYRSVSGDMAPFYRFTRPSHSPHPLFLLTQDLPIPSLSMEDEMENALRLAKWRNSNDKPFKIWKDVFATSNRYTDEFFNACVYLLHSSSRISSLDPPNSEVNRRDIIATISERAVMGSISSFALVALVRAFEHVLDPYKFWLFHKSPSCVQRPISYGRNLQHKDEEVRQIHRTMTLLLARDLQGCSGPESMRRLPEVLAMLWLTPSTTKSHDWRKLEETHEIHCRVSDIEQQILQDWVLYLDGSVELAETLCLLIQASSTHPEVGVHWLHSCAKQSREHLFSLLTHLDHLMCDEQWSESWIKVLKVLCRALKMLTFGTSVNNYGPDSSVMALRNPFIRTIGYCALETDTISEDLPEYPSAQADLMEEMLQFLFWNMSKADAQSTWQLRAKFVSKSLYRISSNVTTRVMRDSFHNPEQLYNLVLIFDHATLCNHHSGPGHILVYLHIETGDRITYPHDFTLFGEIQVMDCQITPIIALLVASSVDEFLSFLSSNSNEECMAHLWDIYVAFKGHQPSLLAFLHDILLWLSEFNWNYELATIAIVLQTIEDTVGRSVDDESASLLLQLSNTLLQLTCHLKEQFSHRKQTVVLNVNAKRIRSIILNKLSSMTVFGRTNLRSLACARISWNDF